MIISGLRIRTRRLPKAFSSRWDCLCQCRRSSSYPAVRGTTWPEPLATCRLTGGQRFRKVVREIRPLTSVGHCWSVSGFETDKNSTPRSSWGCYTEGGDSRTRIRQHSFYFLIQWNWWPLLSPFKVWWRTNIIIWKVESKIPLTLSTVSLSHVVLFLVVFYEDNTESYVRINMTNKEII